MKKIILSIIIGLMLVTTYLSFHAIPDVKLVNVSGYNFGINYSDYWYLKLAFIVLSIILIFKKD